ncbi:MAG: carboxypeptidase regulatory-like domain-containing protein [Blastocatellia bacterium]
MTLRKIYQWGISLSLLLLLSIGASAQTTSQPATANKGGSIAGRVLGDDGQPLADVTVNLISASSNRSARRITTTDDEGSFKIKDLPSGAYTITASVPGFVTSEDQASSFYRPGDQVTISLIKGGVLTGRSLDATGQPLVGAPVSALRVRDAEGRPANDAAHPVASRMTDDRGVYRLYGLPTGFYVVYTGGAGESLSSSIGAREVPTYHPSATRDTAHEVFVPIGAEIQSIDIRHRGEAGHAVSGRLAGVADSGASLAPKVTVELFQANTGTLVTSTNVNTRAGNGFGLYGVPDGEYEIIAQQRGGATATPKGASGFASTLRRVIVRGSDVTGLELRLVALGTIVGRVVLEKLEKADCRNTRRGTLEELLIFPHREDHVARHLPTTDLPFAVTPDEKGEFVLFDLDAGRYRLTPQLPSDHWYVKAVSAPGVKTVTAGAVNNLAATGFTLKSGETLTGVTFTMAEGAAAISGHVESKLPGKQLPARLRIHLVPAEPEASSDVLRYAETVTRDGAFSLRNLTPGKYWLLARAVPDDEPNETPVQPAAWDSNARTALRREASASQVIELLHCQQAKDGKLRY